MLTGVHIHLTLCWLGVHLHQTLLAGGTLTSDYVGWGTLTSDCVEWGIHQAVLAGGTLTSDSVLTRGYTYIRLSLLVLASGFCLMERVLGS